jgi:glycine betaine monooxygenase B
MATSESQAMSRYTDEVGSDRPQWDPTQDDRLVCRASFAESPNARTLVFAPLAPARFSFDPGQYMNFAFRIDGETVERCYSISSSAANESRIAITVKRVQGGRASGWLVDHFPVGTSVRANGPMGNFSLMELGGNPLVLISAGSGVTPMASMLRTMADLGTNADVVFLHYASTASEMLYRDEYASLAKRLPTVRIITVVTRSADGEIWTGATGRVTREMLLAHAPDIERRTILCCGPTGFMSSVSQLARDLGIPDSAYHEEKFDLSEHVALPGEQLSIGDQSFGIRFLKVDQTIQCSPDTTILRAAQAALIPMPSSCMRGACGTCRTKLISGSVDMKHAGGLRPRDIEKGWILPCCSRPTSYVELDR